nr:MAG TPA: hypothetical protein [Microviridae sp.]
MKLKLTFKSASKKVIKKEIEVDAFSLMSLLNDKAIIEIAEQIYDGAHERSEFYLYSITDID